MTHTWMTSNSERKQTTIIPAGVTERSQVGSGSLGPLIRMTPAYGETWTNGWLLNASVRLSLTLLAFWLSHSNHFQERTHFSFVYYYYFFHFILYMFCMCFLLVRLWTDPAFRDCFLPVMWTSPARSSTRTLPSCAGSCASPRGRSKPCSISLTQTKTDTSTTAAFPPGSRRSQRLWTWRRLALGRPKAVRGKSLWAG